MNIAKRGISLISIIITIIIIVILTATVIVNITRENNIIDNTNDSVKLHNMTIYREECISNLMKKQLQSGETFDKNSLNIIYDEMPVILKSKK